MINIRNLTVRYGNVTAVDDISLTIPPGELFGLVGPNGAGKTTTMKTLAGLLLPDAGTVAVGGLDVVAERMAVRKRIGYMVDFFGVYDYLLVNEYLEFFGSVYGVPDETLQSTIAATLENCGLLHKRQSMVKALSRGMKQRLYFARAILHKPDLLILDEPASGMDPRGRAELMSTLQQLNAAGQSIIISSHILDELEHICTSVGIMESGKLIGLQGRLGTESTPAATATRRVRLCIHTHDRPEANRLLGTFPSISSIEPDGDALLLTITNSDDAVAAVVSDLVAAQVRVLLPTEKGLNLQDTFFRITTGETT
jgi:ABC-2 type transport system ATP-binding protein